VVLGSGTQWRGWGLGIFTTIVFCGLIIWVITAFVGWARDGRRDDDPERILARRFAAGEIDADEYQRRLGLLHERHGAATGDRR
jgi:putative membrane protein